MVKLKKYVIFLGFVFFAFVLAACGKDTEPPTITLESDTYNQVVNETVDFLKLVTVTDNKSDASKIKVEVTDWGGYDKSKLGTYVITITATDEAGNFSTAKLTVVVMNKPDTTPPMINQSSVTTINHLAGEEFDLTKGLTGVDNVDGTDVSFKVVDYGTYNKDVAGTYVVKIVAYDKAGNESLPVSRTVIVSESYARAEMISLAGEIVRFKALYNPQVLNGQTGTLYNTAYDGHYVNVLSKEYVKWLLDYAPDRIGAGVGWSVVAVTNADDEIVYVRHWNSGEAFNDSEGNFVSRKATNWSTGTVATWQEEVNGTWIAKNNARYSSGEFGLMMANIYEWIPDGGHVFLFLNWTTLKLDENGKVALKQNESDMARAMGAVHIMNSDVDGDEIYDYGIGRKLYILDKELSDQTVRKSFDKNNPFPIINISGTKYVNDNGVWKIDYVDRVYLSEVTPETYNPLKGVTANDGKGNDITDKITVKYYRHTTPTIKYGIYPSLAITDPLWAEYFEDVFKLSENELTLQEILQPKNNDVYFVIEYTVEANGHEDKAYRIMQVKAQLPDYLELFDSTDAVFSDVFGFEQRLEFNPDLDEFGSFTSTDKGIIFDATTFKSLSTLPTLDKGVVVVLNEKYNVQLIRIANGKTFEIDAFNQVNTEVTCGDLLDGLKDVVLTGGYVLIYPEGKNQAVLNKALRAFYNPEFEGGLIDEVNVVNGAVRVNLKIKEVQEVTTLIVNDVAPEITINGVTTNVTVVVNSKDALIFSSTGGGAGFRLDRGKVYFYTKEMYQILSSSSEVVNSFTSSSPNKGVPWFNNGVAVILDANGNFYQARIAVGIPVQINADGTVIYGNNAAKKTTEAAQAETGEENNLTWSLVTPNANNTKAHGVLANILNDIPDGGSLYIFPNSLDSSVRDLAVKILWNANYGTGAIVDPSASNANTNGFDSTAYTKEYFESLKIVTKYVATQVDKAAKLARPDVTLSENTITWAAITGAAQYNLYVNGKLSQENVGILDETTNTYSFDLSMLGLDDGEYTIQLRAITADKKQYSTSVLSDAITFKSERVSMPTNLRLEGKVVKWDEVVGVTQYLVKVNDDEEVTVDTTEFTIPDDEFVTGTVITVKAKGTGSKQDSVEVVITLKDAIQVGNTVVAYKSYTLTDWFALNNVGGNNIAGFIVVTDLAELATMDSNTTVFNGGYLALVSKDNQVKFVATRWGQSWDEVNGWKLNGANKDAQWAWGLNLKAGYFQDLVEEGDYLVLASQYSTGLPSTTNYRNLFGNELIKYIPNITTSNDHRNVTTFEGAINPKEVAINYVIILN